MKHDSLSNYGKTRFCAYCGTQNSTHNKYCINCGFELANDSLDTIDYQHKKQNVAPTAKQTEKVIIVLPHSRSTRSIVALILFLAIAVLFVATNPNEKEHLDYIQNVRFTDQLNSSSDITAFLLTLGKLIVSEDNINSILKTKITHSNYLFFSITRENQENQIITIGVLGNVFLLEELMEKIESIALKLPNVFTN